MFTLIFWKRAIERAGKTAAQYVLAVWGVSQVGSDQIQNAFDFDWRTAGGAALAGFVLSALFSLVSTIQGDSESPSLVP